MKVRINLFWNSPDDWRGKMLIVPVPVMDKLAGLGFNECDFWESGVCFQTEFIETTGLMSNPAYLGSVLESVNKSQWAVGIEYEDFPRLLNGVTSGGFRFEVAVDDDDQDEDEDKPFVIMSREGEFWNDQSGWVESEDDADHFATEKEAEEELLDLHEATGNPHMRVYNTDVGEAL